MTRIFLLLTILLPVSSSCSLLRFSDPVTFLLPEPDMAVSWEVAWLDRDGSVRRCRAGGGSTVVVDLPRERPVVITAAPLIIGEAPEGFGFQPAGYLAGTPPGPGGKPELNWFDGFAAGQLLVLAEAGVDPALVNVDRFRDGVRDRAGENPWHLDIRNLREDLVSGELWIYSFRTREMLPVQLPLAAGDWAGTYVPDRFTVSGSGGWEGFLPEGTHRYLRIADNAAALVTVDGDGRVLLSGG